MTSRRAQDNLVAAVLLAIFLGVIYLSLGFGPRARTVPIPVAAVGLILTVIQIIWQNLRSTDELHVDLLRVLTGRADGAPVPDLPQGPAVRRNARKESQWRRELSAFGLVALFTGIVFLVGPVPSIFVFTAGYLVLSRHYTWGRGLAFAAVFTAAVYLLFAVALEIQLYHGVLEPVISRF